MPHELRTSDQVVLSLEDVNESLWKQCDSPHSLPATVKSLPPLLHCLPDSRPVRLPPSGSLALHLQDHPDTSLAPAQGKYTVPGPLGSPSQLPGVSLTLCLSLSSLFSLLLYASNTQTWLGFNAIWSSFPEASFLSCCQHTDSLGGRGKYCLSC